MKKTISFLCVLTLTLTSLFSVGFTEDVSRIIGDGNTVIFADVPDSYWAKDEIYYFASQGIVSGIGENKFDPEGGVTREQFTKMLVLAFSAPLSSPSESTFADVNEGGWSYLYVETCKEFLTGYANIFGGKPSFRPTQAATREDIAVALVRMMGLTDSDVKNPNYANNKFIDSDDISPQLVNYVSLATERKLINGYGDGTFAPKKGITRAETVALINRATKQALTNIGGEIELAVSIVPSEDPKNISVIIRTEEGTKVTVDGENVKLSNNGYGEYEGSYIYIFEEESSKTFMVQATKQGKTSKKEVEASYSIGKPVLKITSCPTNVSDKDVTISGTMSDKNYSTELLINGINIENYASSSYYDSWSKNYTLKEGPNTFDIVLKNSAGKETKITKIINFEVGGPTLEITSCPTNVSSKDVKISGTMSDENYSTALSINGINVKNYPSSSYYDSWSKNYTLKEGANTFEIVLKNSLGKETKITKVINFQVGGPTLEITSCPTNVSSKDVKISGTMSDENYSTELAINGINVKNYPSSSYYDSWSKNYILKEGPNTFEIVLKNSLGKETKETKIINFVIASPEISFDNWPELSESNTVNISGSLSGELDGIKLYINDSETSSNYYNEFYKTLKLTEGDNQFIIRAINGFGKSVSVVKNIKYATVEKPNLTVDGINDSVTEEKLMVSGNVTDNFDSNVEVRVNDHVVSNLNGGWSYSINLAEGTNTIIITATNKYNKTITIVKEVKKIEKVISDEVVSEELAAASAAKEAADAAVKEASDTAAKEAADAAVKEAADTAAKEAADAAVKEASDTAAKEAADAAAKEAADAAVKEAAVKEAADTAAKEAAAAVKEAADTAAKEAADAVVSDEVASE